MTKKEHFKSIMNKTSSKSGFWHGNPHADSLPGYKKYFDVADDFGLSVKLKDNFIWLPDGCSRYTDPNGKEAFDITGIKGHQAGQLNDYIPILDATPAVIEKYNWPNADYLDFSAFEPELNKAKQNGLAVFSGMWAPFYHIVADMFGMEEYFIRMYTDPDVIIAVTEHVVDYFLAANEIFFSRYASEIDAYFFGNDFGSQLDLMISPEFFRKFVMPYQQKLINQAKRHGLYAVLHSCGAISRIIPELIDAGIDALHPIQAKAVHMNAEYLAKEYKNDIVFIGGVDTQELLPFGNPQQVYDMVLYLRELFGNNYIVSPSHEALLPNVSPENVEAMQRAAME